MLVGKGPDYDDRYDDGVRGPDAGAEIRASKAKDIYDNKLDDTIMCTLTMMMLQRTWWMASEHNKNG